MLKKFICGGCTKKMVKKEKKVNADYLCTKNIKSKNENLGKINEEEMVTVKLIINNDQKSTINQLYSKINNYIGIPEDFAVYHKDRRQLEIGTFEDGFLLNGMKFIYNKNDPDQLEEIQFVYEKDGKTRYKGKTMSDLDAECLNKCFKQLRAQFIINNKIYGKFRIVEFDSNFNINKIGHWEIDDINLLYKDQLPKVLEDDHDLWLVKSIKEVISQH